MKLACIAVVLIASPARAVQAVARIGAATWIDYLRLAEWNGRRVIVSVPWGLRPEAP